MPKRYILLRFIFGYLGGLRWRITQTTQTTQFDLGALGALGTLGTLGGLGGLGGLGWLGGLGALGGLGGLGGLGWLGWLRSWRKPGSVTPALETTPALEKAPPWRRLRPGEGPALEKAKIQACVIPYVIYTSPLSMFYTTEELWNDTYQH